MYHLPVHPDDQEEEEETDAGVDDEDGIQEAAGLAEPYGGNRDCETDGGQDWLD
ncbi:Hypothetical predicted protein [Scomber scombrus]|uniref:Uncharacterized protein n=1 Tax=Scomber scombrus TaxID=13677 RepID=A0AAV1PGK4_SCOSC